MVAIRRWAALLLSALALVLSGCAANQTVFEGPNAGYAVLSIGVPDGVPLDLAGLHIKPKGGSSYERVFFGNDPLFPMPRVDFNAPSRGFVGSLRLAPGAYEIVDFEARHTATWFSAAQPFSIPFTVDPNGIVYLGEFSFSAVYGKNFFGMSVPAGPLIYISDRQTRDIGILKAQVPQAANLPVRAAVPDARRLNLPFFPVERGAQ